MLEVSSKTCAMAALVGLNLAPVMSLITDLLLGPRLTNTIN